MESAATATHDSIRVPTHKPVNHPVLVPMLDIIFEDFLVLMGAAGMVFMLSVILFRLIENPVIPMILWMLDGAGVFLGSYWLRKMYRARGEMGGDPILFDVMAYLARSRRMPGRRFEEGE